MKSHSLTVGRWDHISWMTSTGDIILLGGSSAQTWQSTELLSDTASADTQPFSLAYDTQYEQNKLDIIYAVVDNDI